MHSLSQLMQISRGCKGDVASAPTTTMLFLTRDEETARHFLRASAADGAAEAGGLGGESQAGVPAIPAGRAGSTAAEPQADRDGGTPGSGDSDPAEERSSMDFISDALSEGREFRSLNIVDDFNRECLAAEVDTSITGARVVRVLERLRERRGNKLALACGVGWVGIVEGAGSTGFSVGFSAFFFCSPSARRPSSVRILNYPAVAIGCHRGGS
jgi:hypothetical protein